VIKARILSGSFIGCATPMHGCSGSTNVGFDWPVVDHLIRKGNFTALDAHNKGTAIITGGDRFAHTVWPSDRIVTQGDLYLIHHFDNRARSTGLKKLEINMRSADIVDLPYPSDQPTTWEQKDEIIAYMCHDVSETLKFYHVTKDQIAFRDTLQAAYPDMQDVLNMNDTKIGKKFFERELERAGTPCYHRPAGRREPRQTMRDKIALRDVISPKIQFAHPEFQRIKSWFEAQTLTGYDGYIEAKGVFTDTSCAINGFTYDFGTGGIHGSQHGVTIREDDDWQIWDWDVASYYPNLAISNRFFPQHLSEQFCDIYKRVYEMRKEYSKGTAENAMLKLALNGVYGDSNNVYSPFYDPQYTMAITINGQLMLCMLAEWLQAGYPDVEMIQINTDGLTVRVRKSLGLVTWMKDVCAAWEKRTGLQLESARYKEMHIRDVNSYIAVKSDGKCKRIGAYAYLTPLDDPSTRERQWHQDHSMLVVRKAAEARMVEGVPVEDFIMAHSDPFDFALSVKVPRSSRLEASGQPVQNTTRYYVSTDGVTLDKVMPPLAKKPGVERHIGVQAGWTVTIINDMSQFRWDNVNWFYYINEAKKLVIDNETT